MAKLRNIIAGVAMFGLLGYAAVKNNRHPNINPYTHNSSAYVRVHDTTGSPNQGLDYLIRADKNNVKVRANAWNPKIKGTADYDFKRERADFSLEKRIHNNPLKVHADSTPGSHKGRFNYNVNNHSKLDGQLKYGSGSLAAKFRIKLFNFFDYTLHHNAMDPARMIYIRSKNNKLVKQVSIAKYYSAASSAWNKLKKRFQTNSV